jgi:heme/copper-type cytochrome/quinol oxidase subunit 3
MARDFGLAGLFRPDAAALPEVDEDRKLRVGMFLYVLADAFMAIFLIGTYIFLRGYNTNGRWFPPGSVAPDVAQNFWIMLIVVVGAVAFGVGEWGLGRGQQSLFRLAMLVAALCYLGDAVFQIVAMAHQPFTVDNAGSYASAFLLLAGYHAYHMLIGAFLGIGVVNRAFRGYYEPSIMASGTTPNVSRGVQAGAVAGHAHVDETTAPEEFPQRNTSGIASIGYYWYYAAIYAVAVWLLLIIQPVNYHPF